jgi:hypothetical protein
MVAHQRHYVVITRFRVKVKNLDGVVIVPAHKQFVSLHRVDLQHFA